MAKKAKKKAQKKTQQKRAPQPRRRRSKQSFMVDSPWIRLKKERDQAPEYRQSCIKKIEGALGAKVITLFTAFSDGNAMIDDGVAEMIENVLAVEQRHKRDLALILNSPGGDALAVERIVNVCRTYSNGRFDVVVPHMAKSAATMICFGARRIRMSKTAELGPVDPQVVYQDEVGTKRWISAQEYLRAYDILLSAAASAETGRIEPHLQQLARFDARFMQQLRSSQDLSVSISVGLLQRDMMKGLPDEVIKQKIKVFLKQEETMAHGRMIDCAEARRCGLAIDVVRLDSALWQQIWELYVRSDWVVTHQCSQLIESTDTSIMQRRAGD